MSEPILYWEGRFVVESEVVLPVTDPAFLFGEGVSTTLRIEDGRAIWLDRHWERLREGCEWLGLPFTAKERDLFELIKRNRAERGEWRGKVCMTGGGRLLMRLDPAPPRSLAPLSVGLYPYPLGGQIYRHKSFSLLERRLIQREAQRKGWDDCLTVTESGYLLEGGYASLFWIDEGVLYTPDWERLPLLPGICLQALLEDGFEAERVQCRLDEISDSAHLFLCNTVRGIMPVGVIEVRPQKVLAVLSDCGDHLDCFSPHPGASTLGSSRSSRSVPPRHGDHLPYLSEDVPIEGRPLAVSDALCSHLRDLLHKLEHLQPN